MNQRFETFAAEVAAGRRAVARDAAHAQWGAFGREDAYDVVALEIPFDGRDAHGEDARGLALRDGRGGPGVEVQGATELALTKLDVLSDLERIPVCVRYLVDGRETDRFPFPAALAGAKPVLEYMEGWNCSISGVRRWEDLPPAAQRYVLFVEQAVGCPITYVSVGPERDSIILRGRGKV